MIDIAEIQGLCIISFGSVKISILVLFIAFKFQAFNPSN